MQFKLEYEIVFQEFDVFSFLGLYTTKVAFLVFKFYRNLHLQRIVTSIDFLNVFLHSFLCIDIFSHIHNLILSLYQGGKLQLY